MVEVRVLGPVVLAGPDGASAPRSAISRTVLGMLAVAGADGLADSELADAVWGPAGADKVAGLSVAVHRVRQWLDVEAGRAVGIRRTAGGYVLDGAEVDARRFVGLLDAGDIAAALALWRGAPLADGTAYAEQAPAVARLQERHRAAVLRHGRLLLADGRPADAVTASRDLADRYELDEPVQALFIEALADTGRQADALRRHEQTRTRLRDELGVSPGPELSRALHTVLHRDQPDGPERRTVPAQLPAAVADFTGRTEALRQLDELVAAREAGAVLVTAIAGTAGVGKTALAVHWAHQVAGHYPDGQLYLNLNGYSAGPPVDPGQAMEHLLRALGVNTEHLPDDLVERSALYRSRLAGRRVLVVLDNASSPDQVRPLLPGDPGCLVVITSRDALPGLVAVDGARRILLTVLERGEALGLLARLIGADRVAAEPGAADRLLNLCARLPLALRVAAANLDLQSVADYVRSLEADRLEALAADGDPQAAVRAHFDHSYERLEPGEQRLFRLLGIVPGLDVDERGAAALAGCSVTDVRRGLRRLVNAHLVTQHVPGRYTFHDLLRAYARDRAAIDDGEPSRDDALQRLFAWQLASAKLAVAQLSPKFGQEPDAGPEAGPVPQFADYEHAMRWLEAERPNLLASIVVAADQGWHGVAWQLPHAIWQFLRIRGYLQDWERAYRLALDATRRLGDQQAEAEILFGLALADQSAGRHQVAIRRLRAALGLRRRLGDRAGEARSLNALAISYYGTGDFIDAERCYQQALAQFRDLGHELGQANALNNLGNIAERLGQYPDALEYYAQALVLNRRLQDARGEGITLSNRGIVYGLIGQDTAAVDSIRAALDLFEGLGDRLCTADALGNLGDVLRRCGRPADAMTSYRNALVAVRDVGDVNVECQIRNGLGQAYRAAGDRDGALVEHERALALTETTANRYQRARAHDGIGRVRHDAGEHDAAREHWAEALAVYTELGVPEAQQLRAELAGLLPEYS